MEDKKPDVNGGVEDGWEQGWDGHEQAQLRRMAQLSLYDKIGWLEEAHRMVRHIQGARTSEAPPEGARQDENESSILREEHEQ